MALDITFSVSIDSDRETVTLTDSTVYGTGGNPARNALAVYVTVVKVNYEGTETPLTVTSDHSEPLTNTIWSFSYSNGDGYYKIRYFAAPFYNVGTLYARYMAVYENGYVYRSVQNGNQGESVIDTDWWEIFPDPTVLCDNKGESSESTNCSSLIYERVFTSNAQYWYGNKIGENCICDDCDSDEQLNVYVTFSILLNGAITADERTTPLTGETICRRIESLYGTD